MNTADARDEPMRFNNIELLRLAAAVGVAVIHLAMYARIEFGIDNEFTARCK